MSRLVSSAETWTGRLVGGRWRIVSLLDDSGGMASVYLANDERLPRKAVVKIPKHAGFNDEFRHRFTREAFWHAKVEHPHVVAILDRGEEDGSPFLVLQYLSGGNLKAWSSGQPSMLEQPSLHYDRWLLPIAQALDAIWRAGVVHRDVKPSNILFDGAGRGYLTDFGIVRAASDKTLTSTGMIIGTLQFMSPEQCQQEGAHAIDGRSDQYGLAVTAYQVLTGWRYPASDDTAVLYATKFGHVPLIRAATHDSRVPRTVDEVLMRALSPDREARLGSCVEFADALLDAFGHLAAPAEHSTADTAPRRSVRTAPLRFNKAEELPRVPQTPEQVRSGPWKRPWLLAAAAVAAVAGGFLVSTLSGSRMRDTPALTPSDPPPLREPAPPGQQLFLQGRKLFNGEGVQVDRAAAFRVFEAAAEKGHPVACTFVAASLVNGLGGNTAGQYEKADAWNRRALPDLRRMALQGNPDAQLAYGELLIDGNVEPRHEDRGHHLIARAAEVGHPPAMVRHALHLAATAETEETKKEVMSILKRAADMGSLEAVIELGKAYEEGVIVDKDEAEAYRLLQQAAMKDDDIAVHNLAHLVLKGRGTTKDEAAAVKLFKRAMAISPTCGFGHARCLAKRYFDGVGVAKDPTEGLRILMTVSETDPAVQLEIATRIDRGDGVQQDTEKATDWFKKAFASYLQQAKRGGMASAVVVGKCLASGAGVKQDRGEARRWLELARTSTDKKVVRDATAALDALDRAGTSQ